MVVIILDDPTELRSFMDFIDDRFSCHVSESGHLIIFMLARAFTFILQVKSFITVYYN